MLNAGFIPEVPYDKNKCSLEILFSVWVENLLAGYDD